MNRHPAYAIIEAAYPLDEVIGIVPMNMAIDNSYTIIAYHQNCHGFIWNSYWFVPPPSSYQSSFSSTTRSSNNQIISISSSNKTIKKSPFKDSSYFDELFSDLGIDFITSTSNDENKNNDDDPTYYNNNNNNNDNNNDNNNNGDGVQTMDYGEIKAIVDEVMFDELNI